jgi:hypothetical protein
LTELVACVVVAYPQQYSVDRITEFCVDLAAGPWTLVAAVAKESLAPELEESVVEKAADS